MNKWISGEKKYEYEHQFIKMVIYRIKKGQWTFRTRFRVKCMNDRELSKATSVWFWKNRRAVEKNIKLIIKNKSIIPMSVEVDEEKMIDFYRVTFDGGLELLTKQDFMDMKEGEE